MLEKNLQKKCIDYLKEKDIYHVNIHGGGWGGKGTPDIIACICGKFVAFELKVGDNKMSPAQRIHKKRIVRNYGLHYVPRSLEEFKKIVSSLLEEIR